MHFLRCSTATTVQFGPFVEVSDGYSYKATTITFTSDTVKYVVESGAVVGIAVAPSLSNPGWMTVPLAISDVAAPGKFALRVGNVTNNLPVWREYMVLTQPAYDAMFVPGFRAEVDTVQINGGAPSDAIAAGVLDYVMFTPGAQSITLKDTVKVMAAALAGRCTGATGTAMVFHGPSGESRVSGTFASGNRATVTWVTG